MKTMQVGVMAALFAATASATMSNPARMIPDATKSLLWRTYAAGTAGVEWEWPRGAASAKLTVAGRGGTAEHVFPRAVSSFAPTQPTGFGDEDVLDVTLEFYASEDASGDAMPSEALSATGLGVVRGVNGAALDFHGTSNAVRTWRKVPAPTAVLPVSEGASRLSLDGTQVEIASAPGWHLWRGVVAERDYAWTLNAADEGFSATLRRTNPRFIFIVK
ncbi:MAG: hypothetical protein IJI36_08015 [Kiritimatiellae bacterium]|nr:hypothetical protein [Kiritimatiellia bacterium]